MGVWGYVYNFDSSHQSYFSHSKKKCSSHILGLLLYCVSCWRRTMCVSRGCWQCAIGVHFLWWRGVNKTLDWQTDKFHAILYCGVCGCSRNSDCYLLSRWFGSHWVGFSLWNLEKCSVGRTPCEKCYINTHPERDTKGTHRKVYRNSESIWQNKSQKSLLL